MNTRQTFFVSVVVLLCVALGAWWYLGFSLDFMRFFASEPGVTDTLTDTTTGGVDTLSRRPIPEGCQLKTIQCIQAPCDPIVECSQVACVAARTTVTTGTSVDIYAYGGTGGYAFAAPQGVIAMKDPSGTNAAGGLAGVQYDTPGVKRVFVTAQRASDPTLTDVATCPVTVIPAAVTN